MMRRVAEWAGRGSHVSHLLLRFSCADVVMAGVSAAKQVKPLLLAMLAMLAMLAPAAASFRGKVKPLFDGHFTHLDYLACCSQFAVRSSHALRLLPLSRVCSLPVCKSVRRFFLGGHGTERAHVCMYATYVVTINLAVTHYIPT